MTGWLARLSVHRPVTVLMIFLALAVLGVIAWVRIPLQMMPDGFVVPELGVWLDYPNATPQETQAAVVLPTEEHLSTVPGLRELRSNASSDGAWVSIDFNRSVDMDAAYNDIVDRMDRALADLPDEVDRYWVWRWNPNDEPIIWAGVRLPTDIDNPYWVLSELVQRRIERVPGVGKVESWGVNGQRAYVDFSLQDLLSTHTSLFELIGLLRGDNFQLAGGRLEERGQVRYVRSLARWGDLDELRQLPVGDGLKLGDVARVQMRQLAETDINHIDGAEGAALAVYKESGANTVATSKAVAEAFAELEADPRLGGARFFTFFDQGDMIRDSVNNLLISALQGGIFAIVILYVFLREWRMTVLIAAAIPFSLLVTVSVLYLGGRTLNLISLLGLMLAVGMLVDNAIVVVEAIYTRRQADHDKRVAAVEGTKEVGLAIALSTATTMVVFLPVILMSEDATFSFFMGELGLPVVYALAASLLVALVFTPLTTTFVRGSQVPPEPRWVTALAAGYERALRTVLTSRSNSYVGLIVGIALTLAIPVQAVSCNDEAHGNINDFQIRYELQSDFTHAEREAVVAAVEKVVDDNHDLWGVRVHRSRMGADSRRGNTWVYLDDDRADGAMAREDVIEDAKAKLPDLPGVRIYFGRSSDGSGSNSVTFSLKGDDTATLIELSEEVKRRIQAIPGVLGVRTDLESSGAEEIRLRVDRDAAARQGLDATRIGQTVAFAMRGMGLNPIRAEDKEIEVRARFREEDRAELDRLLDFPLSGANGSVPLRAVVHAEQGRGYGTLRRENRATAWPLTVDLDEDADAAQIGDEIRAALASFDFPRGYGTDWARHDRDSEDNDDARGLALLLSVVFVFLLMGVLFESYLLPLAVITTIPMALLGAWWALYFTGTVMDVMGGIGLVILVGVVVNNGIVLVDMVTHLRAEGLDLIEAFAQAGRRRLRPILMTALTTIAGLIPMATGDATFVGIPYAPLGRVLAGGMIAGTVLTLFFLPYLYLVLDDLRGAGARWLAWVIRRPEQPETPL